MNAPSSSTPQSRNHWDAIDRAMKAGLWGLPSGPDSEILTEDQQEKVQELLRGSEQVFIPSPGLSSSFDPVIQGRLVRRALRELETQGRLGTLSSYLRAFPDHEKLVRSEHARVAITRGTADADLGPYRLISILGRGGQGTVHLAEDMRLGRHVALKVLNETHEPESSRLVRFLREAEITAQLEDPHICTIYEIGIYEGRACIAMRHIDGPSLEAECVDALPLGRKEILHALGVMEKVARAVHVAHVRGIVHRDIKPNNILLATRDIPILVDFGLARFEDLASASLTGRGGFLGTPAYVAPEILENGPRGESAGDSGVSGDIWAFGVTLFEWITGQRPFQGSTREALYRSIIQGRFPLPRRLNPHVSRDLGVLLMTCLERDVNRRYQSMDCLADDILRIRERRPIQARRPSFARQTWSWVERQPSLAAALAILLLVLTIGMSTSLALWNRERHERQRAENALIAESRAMARAESMRLTTEARMIRDSRPGLAILLAMESTGRESGPLALSTLSSLLLKNIEEHIAVGHEDAVIDVAFTHGSESFLTGSSDGTARVWRVDDGEESLVFREHEAPLRGIAHAPHSDRVASIDGDGILLLWSSDTGRVHRRIQASQSPLSHVSFSRSGDLIATASEEGAVDIWSWGNGRMHTHLADFGDTVGGLQFMPEPGRLFVGTSEGEGTLWYYPTSSLLQKTRSFGEDFNCLAISEDGETLIIADEGPGLWSWNVRGDQLDDALVGHEHTVTHASFATQGPWIGTASLDRTALIWNSTSMSIQRRLRGHQGRVVSLAFSQNGKYVVTASTDKTARLWSLETHPRLWTQADAATTIVQDGRGDIICLQADGALHVKSIEDGRLLTQIDSHVGGVLGAVSSMDGTRLLTIGSDAFLRLWDSEGETEHLAIDVKSAFPGESMDAVFDDHGERILVVTASGVATVFSARDGRVLASIEGRPLGGVPTPQSAAFDHSGKRVITVVGEGRASTLVLWDVETSTVLAYLQENGSTMTDLALSPEEDLVAWSCVDGRVNYASLDRPNQVHEFIAHQDEVTDLSFSPDGSRLVSGCQNGLSRIGSLDSGQSVIELRGHNGPVTRVAFDGDGRRVLTTSFDHTVRLWDAESGHELFTHSDHPSIITTAFFSPEGDSVVSHSLDGTVCVWPTDPLAYAKEHFRRRLTHSEAVEFGIRLDDLNGATSDGNRER